MSTIKKHFRGLTAVLAAFSLVLVAWISQPETVEDKPLITIGVHNGWEEGIAASNLWKVILEDEGYEVSLETADPGPVYTALAAGRFDVNFDVWLPLTHADYIEKYKDDIVDLGSWFDDAKLTIAVNSDAPITSLTELAANADVFDNRLVGIDSGAGLTRITKDAVIPTYGLESINFLESSTPAMLAELKGAQEAGRDIVVTLWRPHWAYSAFDIRDLEDPEGTLGEAEEIHTYSRSGFSDDEPEVDALFRAFIMTGDELASLEEVMFNTDGEVDYPSVARQWLKDHPDFVKDLKARAEDG